MKMMFSALPIACCLGLSILFTACVSSSKKGSLDELQQLMTGTYDTSRVSISRLFVQSRDQGFNAADEQVWGATEGGYMFLREK